MAGVANFSGRPLPDDVQPVLQKIADLFQNSVFVDGVQGHWVNFRVFGQSNESVCMRLDQEKQRVFGDDGWLYQVVCSPNGAKTNGLWIQCLDDDNADADCRAGVWFY